MTHKLFAGIAVLLVGFCVPAFASDLSGAQIKNKISGKRILLSTGYGVELPLIYSTSGKVTGDGTRTGLGKYFAPKETGKWWVKGNQLCQKFPTWYKGRTFCFELKETGRNTLKWKRSDGKSGTARIS